MIQSFQPTKETQKPNPHAQAGCLNYFNLVPRLTKIRKGLMITKNRPAIKVVSCSENSSRWKRASIKKYPTIPFLPATPKSSYK